MPFDLGRWIAAQKQNGFTSFQGADVAGSIPVRQALLNQLLHEVVAQQAANKIEAVHLEILPGHLRLHIKPKIALLPAQQFLFKIVEGNATFPASPRWRFKLVTKGFWEAMKFVALQQLAASLFPLPNWLRFGGEVVEIDWQKLLREAGQEEMARHLSALTLQAHADFLMVGFLVQVK